MGKFIEKQERSSLVKDFLRSKRSERQWSRHRVAMLGAIRDWHHSMEGRRRHRQLARYLSTRDVQAGGLFGFGTRSLFEQQLNQLPEEILLKIISDDLDEDTIGILENQFPELLRLAKGNDNGISR